MMEIVPGQDGLEIALPDGKLVLKKEVGYSPVEVTVLAVASCANYVLESILTKQQIAYEFIKTEVEYERDQAHKAMPINAIEVTFTMRAASEQQVKIKKALRLIHGNCPVIQSLNEDIEVMEEIIFID
ncbi:OsmC family protein [Brochothrix campestris]|uniref:OsmC-like family protein n=1 Tax=Brochothrix campestris FSL F6-1037 TaxID=1265861 RepID=W7CIH1_9LIST|nr:OsmC family protein [Brochothrix campestris]EUJ39179.1 osmC-like family protein [Brochothrix campestris FSL F6-1037]